MLSQPTGRVCRSQAWLLFTAVLLTMSTQPARADFYNAFKNYQEKKFDEAAVLFEELAVLGHGPSQFNLGVMYVRGESVAKDQGVGLGWMLAANDNGHTQMSSQQLAEFKSRLTPEQAVRADKIMSQYGRDALEINLLPGRTASRCRNFKYAGLDQRARGFYPLRAQQDGQDGVVLLELTVGTDGLARDPHVVVGVPEDVFDDATIDVFLKSRFIPAERDGAKIETRMLLHFTYFHEDGGALWKLSSVETLKKAAEQKNPNGQYLVGMIGSLDSTLGIPRDEARAMLLSSAQAGHPNAQYWAAHQTQYDQLCGAGNKTTAWLQHAARGGNSNAQIELANLRIAAGMGQFDVDEVKRLLASAAERDNPYALKHAIGVLSASPIDAVRDAPLALAAAEKLRKHSRNADPHVEEAMAAAYAANANFREAVKLQERAIDKAEDLYWNTEIMEERLTGYRAGKHGLYADLFAVPAAKSPPPSPSSKARDCSKRTRGCERIPDQKRTPTGSFIKE
jgi:TonB family protein